MIGRKNAVWENELGQRVEIDNKFLFLESIDMTGTSGIHTVESLAGADGQITVSSKLAPKTIPCTIALNNRRKDEYMSEYLSQVFSPLTKGRLIVYTKTQRYEIECRPQDFPVFQRDKVSYVWRFDVDFAADYPLWKKGGMRDIAVGDIDMSGYNRILKSNCPFEIAPDIYFPATNENVIFQLYPRGSTSKQISLMPHNFPVLINTLEFKIINADDGSDQSQLIDATTELDSIRIRYGENIVVASPNDRVRIQYYELSNGEI